MQRPSLTFRIKQVTQIVTKLGLVTLFTDPGDETYRTYMETRPPEVLSNIAICLIHQASYLLDQQIRRLEKDFLKKGGLRKNMPRARLDYRKKYKE